MLTLDTIQSALHSIEVKNAAGNALDIDASGYITVKQGTSPWTVDGTVELGATTLAALENITATISGDVNVTQGTSPWVVGGTVELGATTLAALESITVVATQLDIDDLDYTSDNVAIKGATGNQLVVNADGSLNAQVFEGGFSNWQVTAASVTTTESSISALSNRLKVEIQNLGSHDIWIRESTGVSSSNGFKIPKGSSFEQTLDAGASVYMIASAGSSDVRIAQYAA